MSACLIAITGAAAAAAPPRYDGVTF